MDKTARRLIGMEIDCMQFVPLIAACVVEQQRFALVFFFFFAVHSFVMLHFVVTFEVPLQSCGFALQCCSRVRFLSLSTFSLNPKNFCTTECKASVLFCFVFRSHHSQRGFPLHLFSCFHSSSFRSCQQAAASLALSLFTLPASLSLSWHFLALSFVQGRSWSA